jgi:23S rRNA (uracil1939-C5)-methyltransferase
VGTIGLNLLDGFKRLVGIEINAQAVEDAHETAVYNGYLRAEFRAGKVEDLIRGLWSMDHGTCTVVVDPPRVGLHKGVVEAILDVNPEHLYYVSCNPETLARDLRLLVSKYTIEKVQPMDFFPHTDHVETAVKLWNPRTSNH